MPRKKIKKLKDFDLEDQREIRRIHLEAIYKGYLYKNGSITERQYRNATKKLQSELDTYFEVEKKNA